MKINDLESLLDRESLNAGNISNSLSEDRLERSSSSPLKADKSADLKDFIKMVSKVVSMAMSSMNVEFIPDEGKRIVVDPEKNLDHPYITYRVISRVPKLERKARERGVERHGHQDQSHRARCI